MKRYGHARKDCPHAKASSAPGCTSEGSNTGTGKGQQVEGKPRQKEQEYQLPKQQPGLRGEWMDQTHRWRTKIWRARKEAAIRQLAVEDGFLQAPAGRGSGRMDRGTTALGKGNRFAALDKDVGKKTDNMEIPTEGEESDLSKKGSFVFRGDGGKKPLYQVKTNSKKDISKAKTKGERNKSRESNKERTKGVRAKELGQDIPVDEGPGPVEAENPNAERNRRRKMRRKIKKNGGEVSIVLEDSGREGTGPTKKPKHFKYLADPPPPTSNREAHFIPTVMNVDLDPEEQHQGLLDFQPAVAQEPPLMGKFWNEHITQVTEVEIASDKEDGPLGRSPHVEQLEASTQDLTRV